MIIKENKTLIRKRPKNIIIHMYLMWSRNTLHLIKNKDDAISCQNTQAH